MKNSLENYKNIDKSTHCIFTEQDTFKVLQFNNLLDHNELFKMKLQKIIYNCFFVATKIVKWLLIWNTVQLTYILEVRAWYILRMKK